MIRQALGMVEAVRIISLVDEVDQEELVDNIGAEPKFDEEEEVQEENVEVDEELQFDEDETANEDWAEGDVNPLLMLQPDSIPINEDFEPKITGVEWPVAAKCDKDEALREGNTAAEQGTTMVVVDKKLGIKTEKHPTPYMARLVLETMPAMKNIVSWTSMIAGLAMHGHREEAIQFLHEMEESGIKPDRISFVSVLYACSHAGLI
ncbi:hypothetical protein LWI28_010725 [Acer negundo]|uniref:Pentatricopeptide repeat-containing protein n=1 Tax=Acer negundo TaxID=4023 RepID=A0AAD5NH17_ACENE|nr:hypothetical protein LWI28_010725 [Acer negundo]